MTRFCDCYTCRKLRKRKGLVLGSRRMGFWLPAGRYSDEKQYYFGNVSDYVPHPKFKPGRRPDKKFNAEEIVKEY